jgi:hypothetical protein
MIDSEVLFELCTHRYVTTLSSNGKYNGVDESGSTHLIVAYMYCSSDELARILEAAP